jgi:hypothetical protein
MPIYTMFSNTAVATNSTSSVATPLEQPDQFGLFVVKHDGLKFSTGATPVITLEGSFDNTTWVSIESVTPADPEYLEDPVNNSWVKVVPLMNYMRVRVGSGASRNYWAWISE